MFCVVSRILNVSANIRVTLSSPISEYSNFSLFNFTRYLSFGFVSTISFKKYLEPTTRFSLFQIPNIILLKKGNKKLVY